MIRQLAPDFYARRFHTLVMGIQVIQRYLHRPVHARQMRGHTQLGSGPSGIIALSRFGRKQRVWTADGGSPSRFDGSE